MPGRSRIFRLLAAAVLVVAGGAVLLFGVAGLIDGGTSAPRFEVVRELVPGSPGFPEIEPRYPIRKIDRLSVSVPNGHGFLVDVAYYLDGAGESRQALVFLPADPSSSAPAPDLNQLRWNAWLDAGNFLRASKSQDALVLTWWDNAQRIDLLSGSKTWADRPIGKAFDPAYRDFWNRASGGYAREEQALSRLAGWLLSDAKEALASIEQSVGDGRDWYLMVSVDDLARLSEMTALSGKPAPFETRVFRADDNIHRLISRVKRWAREKGTGSYLVQHLADAGVRVWRITSREGEKTLLARLLPFTSSLAEPLSGLALVHRSDWSGFLSVFHAKASEPASTPRPSDPPLS